MAQEIERKFLCKFVPKGLEPKSIKQGYIFIEKGRHLRIRIVNNKIGLLTLKFDKGQVRDEFEYGIPLKDANEMYIKCNFWLEKTRYVTQHQNFHVDIDKYNNGLIVAEIEFDTLKQSIKFDKFPDYFGEEITGMKKYSNILMAQENFNNKK